MSHFSLLVKVNKDRLEKGVTPAVKEMMAPYSENIKVCPKEVLEWIDKTYEVEENCKLLIEAGDYMGNKYPHGIGKTLEEFYGGKDVVAEEYSGYKFNSEKGQYGYFANLQAKWDWYEIGGRWSGILPVKPEAEVALRGQKSWTNENEPDEPNMVDACLAKDLDLGKITSQTQANIDKFWERYQRYLEVKNISPDELTQEDHWLIFEIPNILQKFSLSENISKKDLLGFIWYFEWSTYAVLDDNGWHEKDNSKLYGAKGELSPMFPYFDNFLNVDGETLLVIVDCHT